MFLYELSLVALGGALGALCRWKVGVYCRQRFNTPVDWGTLSVNFAGSALLGFFMVFWGSKADALWQTFFTTGFLGAFTTFSTFSLNVFLLLKLQKYRQAVMEVFLNIVLCLTGGVMGFLFGASL